MNPPPPDVRSLFGRALEIASAAERAAFLDEACGGNAELRAEVESLLQAIEHAGSFMKQPAPPGDPRGTVEHAPIAERAGTVIGPYKLMEQIGEGGMGLVFVAEQQHPVRRKVALKIIKPGMDSRQVIARFEAERQALALMDHQNIARVLDAGTTESGRPYFVMELVHGIPITKFCDDRKLTPRQRLELFVPVCQAVQHAHQKGIIHRDLKPSNILVTMYDDKPVPKVIDFGVAKALEQRLTDKTMFTQFGTLVGTFEYMSPEQAEMNAFGVDTRSDIYSLGVLLYELLTGTTPLEQKRLREAALQEMVRLIKEEEAPRPSARLSSSNNLPKIAAARSTEPARLSRLVRGDIDWIVMKCLEKDRTRRYESASGLARDIERALADEPVEACPPSAGYRLGKFARKYRTPLLVAGAFVLLLVTGVIVSIWQAVRATAAENAARASEEAAQDRKQEADDAKEKAERQRDELRRQKYISDMNLAQHAWEANNLVGTRRLLDQHWPRPGEADLRGFEWHYLRRLFHGDLWTVNAHAGPILKLAYTPDGRRLFSYGKVRPAQAMGRASGVPGEIKLWNAATGREVPLNLKGPTDKVVRIALSRDGGRLAAACGRDGIRVWDLDTGQAIALPANPKEVCSHVSFSPDGARLVALSRREDDAADQEDVVYVVRIWDLAARKAIVTLDKLGNFYLVPTFSPDGKHLAVAFYLVGAGARPGCGDGARGVLHQVRGREGRRGGVQSRQQAPGDVW
jgi:serine/threonine protein kinase